MCILAETLLSKASNSPNAFPRKHPMTLALLAPCSTVWAAVLWEIPVVSWMNSNHWTVDHNADNCPDLLFLTFCESGFSLALCANGLNVKGRLYRHWDLQRYILRVQWDKSLSISAKEDEKTVYLGIIMKCKARSNQMGRVRRFIRCWLSHISLLRCQSFPLC